MVEGARRGLNHRDSCFSRVPMPPQAQPRGGQQHRQPESLAGLGWAGQGRAVWTRPGASCHQEIFSLTDGQVLLAWCCCSRKADFLGERRWGWEVFCFLFFKGDFDGQEPNTFSLLCKW